MTRNKKRKNKIDIAIDTVLERYGRELIGFSLGVFTAGITSLGFVFIRGYKPSDIQINANQQKIEEVLGSNNTDIQTVTVSPLPAEEILHLLININTASQSELESLPGIGPAIASRIIANRPYKSSFEIQRVSGIGAKKYEVLRKLISVE